MWLACQKLPLITINTVIFLATVLAVTFYRVSIPRDSLRVPSGACIEKQNYFAVLVYPAKHWVTQFAISALIIGTIV
jgi:hypothetical protein